MPKKTRQEKILARLHRLEQSQIESSEPQNVSNETNLRPTGFSLKEAVVTKDSTPTHSRNEVVDYSYVLKDLRKTLALTGAALLIEIVLSLTASGWYAKLFPRLF